MRELLLYRELNSLDSNQVPRTSRTGEPRAGLVLPQGRISLFVTELSAANVAGVDMERA